MWVTEKESWVKWDSEQKDWDAITVCPAWTRMFNQQQSKLEMLNEALNL